MSQSALSVQMDSIHHVEFIVNHDYLNQVAMDVYKYETCKAYGPTHNHNIIITPLPQKRLLTVRPNNGSNLLQ